MACTALTLFLSAPCVLGQNPLAQAQTHDTGPSASKYRIGPVIVRGNRRIPASTIRKSISIKTGDIYDPAKVEHDLAALKDTGYFDDVRADTKDEFGSTDRKIVIFYVRETNESVPSGTPASPPAPLPDEVGEQYNRASKLLWAGDLKDAQSAFEAVLQKKPDNLRAKTLLGLTLTRLSEQSENLGEATLAVAQLREALGLDPDEAYWHSALAKLLHAQGNAQEATKECAQAARLSPDDSDLARGCGFGATPEIWKDDTFPKTQNLTGTQGWTPAIPQNHIEPPYSEKARAAQLQGTTVLWLVVSDHGDVEQAAVEQPLGLGLDESALRTVRTWTFKPAISHGAPVRVRVMAEISFRLY